MIKFRERMKKWKERRKKRRKRRNSGKRQRKERESRKCVLRRYLPLLPYSRHSSRHAPFPPLQFFLTDQLSFPSTCSISSSYSVFCPFHQLCFPFFPLPLLTLPFLSPLPAPFPCSTLRPHVPVSLTSRFSSSSPPLCPSAQVSLIFPPPRQPPFPSSSPLPPLILPVFPRQISFSSSSRPASSYLPFLSLPSPHAATSCPNTP